MNGAKRSAEVMGYKNTLMGERSALERSLCVSGGGRRGSENVGLSNTNIGENPMPQKCKSSSSRRYGAEVTHAILPKKARMTLDKRVSVPEIDTSGTYFRTDVPHGGPAFMPAGTATGASPLQWNLGYDTCLHKVVRLCMGLAPQCRKVKKVGDLRTGETTIEVPVNNSHNYNGPKGGRRRRPPFEGGPSHQSDTTLEGLHSNLVSGPTGHGIVSSRQFL
ncbi:hypothetical protein CQW23_08035 [Capsicum baccatum]|uniref:Uncharacterized protein n=1 Tax=Capsicum baccatum TaxID=33114 RepID=A0A2G2X7W5_CAPBA|nr:hypothetical protein CQW23_08035 [Capsicum baccatum]